jgi:hypothetical protein
VRVAAIVVVIEGLLFDSEEEAVVGGLDCVPIGFLCFLVERCRRTYWLQAAGHCVYSRKEFD